MDAVDAAPDLGSMRVQVGGNCVSTRDYYPLEAPMRVPSVLRVVQGWSQRREEGVGGSPRTARVVLLGGRGRGRDNRPGASVEYRVERNRLDSDVVSTFLSRLARHVW